jgi:hypothetical protein
MFKVEDEVPFDYGERWGSLRGLIKVPSGAGGNGFCHGLGVGPRGEILVLVEPRRRPEQTRGRGDRFLHAVRADAARGGVYQQTMLPGVFYGGHLVFTWDRRGEMTGEDLVPGLGSGTCGVRSDRESNIYVGSAARPPSGAHGANTGVLMKFPPQGGKVYGRGVTGGQPKRPPDFKDGLWARNLVWSSPGYAMVPPFRRSCTCPQARFDVDIMGRCFIPEAYRFRIAIRDTNGNLVTYVGRYGNADSGRGPDSPVKVPGGIAVATCCYLCTVTDEWLYLNDQGNNRLVRLKLGYAAEQRAPLEEERRKR